MSVLEIGNRLRDTTFRAAHGWRPASLLGEAELTEGAMRDWAAKYPADPWLPKDWARLVHLYALLHCSAGRVHMNEAYAWSNRRYRREHSIVREGREVARVNRVARRYAQRRHR